MRIRTIAISAVCAVSLVLAGCSTDVAGTPQPVSSQNANSQEGDNASQAIPTTGEDSGTQPDSLGTGKSPESGGLGLPDGVGGLGSNGVDPSDLGDLLGGLGSNGVIPSDLSGLGDALGQGGVDPSDLGGLLDGVDPSALGNMGDLLGSINTGCLALAGVTMAVGVTLLGPSMGGNPLTQSDVDRLFDGVDTVPDGAQGAMARMHDLLSQAVGKSGTEVQQILSSDEYNDAMEELTNALDSQCS